MSPQLCPSPSNEIGEKSRPFRGLMRCLLHSVPLLFSFSFSFFSYVMILETTKERKNAWEKITH